MPAERSAPAFVIFVKLGVARRDPRVANDPVFVHSQLHVFDDHGTIRQSSQRRGGGDVTIMQRRLPEDSGVASRGIRVANLRQ